MALTILALDTTTRPGSAALLRDGRVLDVVIGDAARTHGERLPGDLLTILGRQGMTLDDVDLYAVAAGPGSFTGLRIGIACMQALALVHDRRVVAVSTLDALAVAAAPTSDEPIAVWLDAQRGQVFSNIYARARRPEELTPLTDPRVDAPIETLRAWHTAGLLPRVRVFAGDGAVLYRDVIRGGAGTTVEVIDPPPVAPALGRIAHVRAADAVHPAAIQPIYIRRPDAELAREQRRTPRPA